MGCVLALWRVEGSVMETVRTLLLFFMLGAAIAGADIGWEIVRERWIVCDPFDVDGECG